MTIKSLRVLSLLKGAQVKEDYMILIDREGLTVSTVWNGQMGYRRRSLKRFEGEINSVLESLIKNGYVKKRDDYSESDVYQVTHEGWHKKELIFHDMGAQFMHSILCPIVVSFFTAIITVILTLHYLK